MKRVDGRTPDQLRPTILEAGVIRLAEGSSRISSGDTTVLCAATIDERVPPFLKGSGRGWVTAEYGMLPRSSGQRIAREAVLGKQGGRTQEIQRLIGRSLRAVTDLQSLGERTIILDCDVLDADGGTRTASITGAAVALHQALAFLVEQEKIPFHPMRDFVCAISVGLVRSHSLLDLCYAEDSKAEVDCNVVKTGKGDLVEIQGTAEGATFSRDQLNEMLDLADQGCRELHLLQKAAVKSAGRG